MRTNDLLHDFARNARYWAILAQVIAWYIPCMHVLAELLLSSHRFCFCLNHFFRMYLVLPLHQRVSDLIHPGFFILRTYALWNNSRIMLAVMLSTFFVSFK
jgi:hypothetical protein